MLHHRHQLHVGEAEVVDVGDQLVDQLVPGQRGAVPLAPRGQVDLVDRHRLADRLLVPTLGHPHLVAPGVRRLVDPARRRRRHLGPGGHRVGLLPPLSVGAEDDVLVAGAAAHTRDEQLPDARLPELAHRVLAAVPAVEVALEPDAARPRRPDRERRARHVAGRRAVVVDPRAQHRPEQLVPPLVDQVEVHLAERRQEPVRVVDGDRALPVVHLDPVVRYVPGLQRWLRRALCARLETTGRAGRDPPLPDALVHVAERDPGAVREHRGHRAGERFVDADRDRVTDGVRSEDRVRLAVLTPDQLVDQLGRHAVGGHLGHRRVSLSCSTRVACPSAARGMGSHAGRLRAS